MRKNNVFGLVFLAIITILAATLVTKSSNSIQTTPTEAETKPSTSQKSSRDENEIKYLKMINEDLGFEICSNGILHTSDGGKTWGQINYPKLTFGDFLNGVVVDFISPKTGWIIMSDHLTNLLQLFFIQTMLASIGMLLT